MQEKEHKEENTIINTNSTTKATDNKTVSVYIPKNARLNFDNTSADAPDTLYENVRCQFNSDIVKKYIVTGGRYHGENNEGLD